MLRSNNPSMPPSVIPTPPGTRDTPPNSVDDVKINVATGISKFMPNPSNMKNTASDSADHAVMLYKMDFP